MSTRALNTCNKIFFNIVRIISTQIRNLCRRTGKIFHDLGSLNGKEIHLTPDHYFISLIRVRKFLAQVGTNRNGRAKEIKEDERM